MDPRFPVGQARLETLGVLLCALIMALASVQVRGGLILSWDTLMSDVKSNATHDS